MDWCIACPYAPGSSPTAREHVGRFDSTSASCGAVYSPTSDEWGIPSFDNKFVTFYIRSLVDLVDFKANVEVELYLSSPGALFADVYVPTPDYWQTLTENWPSTLMANQPMTVTVQVSNGNFVMQSYPYSQALPSGGVFLEQVRINLGDLSDGQNLLDDILLSASPPTPIIPGFADIFWTRNKGCTETP